MFTKKAWVNASPKNNHFFLKLYTLEEFAICAMSTSQLYEKRPYLIIDSVKINCKKESHIYPNIYVIKDNMSSVMGRKASEKEQECILDFFAYNFMDLKICYIEDNGNFHNLPLSNEDAQFIKTLMKNALIKGGYL